MNKKTLVITLLVYIASSALSYAGFSLLAKSPLKSVIDQAGKGGVITQEEESTKLAQLLQIDPSEPKDQVCPLNGKLFTKTEMDAWSKKRPLAVMIENSPDARPQSGLSDADIVFEALAEGGVTRFMGMFYCGVQKYDTTIAPVRSARTYFIDWASGFNYPLYTHVGGANLPGPANALGQLSDYGWTLENNLNQFSIGYPTFVRNANRLDREVATEHTMETTSEKLWTVADERGWTNMSPERFVGKKKIGGDDWKDGYTVWKFQDSAPKAGTVNNIAYEFWDGFSEYGVSWKYEPSTNTYKRTMAGAPHTDLNNDKQIEASTVITLFTKESKPIDELKHILYTTIGKGNVTIYQNGDAIKGTWEKKDREAQIKFFDRKGQEIELSGGLIWISVLDDSTKVTE